MKDFFLLLALSAPLSIHAEEPVRCKSMTIWGQCTNEALPSDSICSLHKQAQQTAVFQSASQQETSRQTTSQQTTSQQSTTRVVSTTPPTRASTQAAAPGRCQARTKRGVQCSRSAQSGSIYCWQHRR